MVVVGVGVGVVGDGFCVDGGVERLPQATSAGRAAMTRARASFSTPGILPRLRDQEMVAAPARVGGVTYGSPATQRGRVSPVRQAAKAGTCRCKRNTVGRGSKRCSMACAK